MTDFVHFTVKIGISTFCNTVYSIVIITLIRSYLFSLSLITILPFLGKYALYMSQEEKAVRDRLIISIIGIDNH